jgi:hypothetical protein
MKPRLSPLQRQWLTGLRDDLNYDRTYRPHAATEAACERHGWAEYRNVGGTKMAWRITRTGRDALKA